MNHFAAFASRDMNCFAMSDRPWTSLCELGAKPKPEFKGHRKLQILVDSGAAENVLPADILPDYEPVEGEARKKNVMYMTADGHEMPNFGEKFIPFKTFEGHEAGIKFQVADVRRPLLSVTAMTAQGNSVFFHEDGGTIVSKDGSKQIDFHRQDGVYVLNVWVAPFPGQGA